MADLIGGIRRLNNSNYKYWRTCMQSYLQGQELWSIVGGREAIPPLMEDAEAFQKWEAKAGKAMYALKISVEEEFLEYIEDADTPKVIWDTYAMLFSRTNYAARLQQLGNEQVSTSQQQDLSLQKRQEEDYGETNMSSMLLLGQVCRRFSLADIKAATQNFNEEFVIGRGGFGKVYKGIIGDVASPVAIKRLDLGSKQGAPEFWTEIEMLSKFRHSHLVTLIGYCNAFHEMIIVYESMPGGTLADRLYKIGRSSDDNSSRLSWVQRLKICTGAARGLEYLHTGIAIQERVIHRDVKSSNILLDENGEAKISDFGLSKIGPANQAWTYVSTNVKGTFGYLDPEYFFTHRLTRKSDVYAFGVVLFEVLCGRPAVDVGLEEEQRSLAGWAKQCIQEGQVQQMVDPSLSGSILENCLSVFAQIAHQCLHNSSKMRPTMAEVVTKLDYALALQETIDFSEVNSEILYHGLDYNKQEKVDSSTELEGDASYVCDIDEQVDGIIQLDDASHNHSDAKSAKRLTLLKKFRLLFSSKPQVVISDILGSSLQNLNANGNTARRNGFFILAFEVANTIFNGSNLLQSFSKEKVQFLKEQLLYSEAVQRLVSTDREELLSILAADKREELHIFSKEVVRFGDMCIDPRWHNLGRYFSRLYLEPSSKRKHLREEVELTMQQLITVALHTDELYHEIVTFDRSEKDYAEKLIEVEYLHVPRRGQSLKVLRSELKHQKELLRRLKKKSLWSKGVEEVVEKLVVVVDFIHEAIVDAFGYNVAGLTFNGKESETNRRPNTLGAADLSLHYANSIIQIDIFASSPTAQQYGMKDDLYHSLPTSVKTALFSRIKSLEYHEESMVPAKMEAEMRKILEWLVPIARDTIKSHQSFRWFVEGSNTGTNEFGKKRSANTPLIRLQTLYHADKPKADLYILDVLTWLHRLMSRLVSYRYNLLKSVPDRPPTRNKGLSPRNSIKLSAADKDLLEKVAKRRRPVLGISKSQELLIENRKMKYWASSKSTGTSPRRKLL